MSRRLQKIFFCFAVCLSISSAQRTVPNSGVFWAPMTINNITAWYASDGRQEAVSPELKFSGAVFPRNTSAAVYSSGFYYGGILNDTGISRTFVNGGYYFPTFRQGAILGTGTGLSESIFDPKVRIWRIRKDFITADLRRDASVTYGIVEQSVSIMDMQRLRNEYKKDWKEWPAAAGAPYYDKNGNNIYDPSFTLNEFGVEIPDTSSDEPGLAGADQVIWYVCNDLSEDSPWDSDPVGLEQQITVWGYNTSGAMANTLYRRCRLIYKGTASVTATPSLTKMYIAIWSDADLGYGVDNFAGSDSVLGLGYVYNSRVRDPEYLKFNIVPPAIGYDILQGPVVKGTSIDSALVNFSYRNGYRNLPVSSVSYFSQFNPQPFLNSSGGNQVYNTLAGLDTRLGTARIDPLTQRPTRFWNNGDPVTRTGWIDGVYEGAGSRDLIVSSGPFTMALGDTQEIVTALIGAHSPDRVGSVNVLKYYDKQVQDDFLARTAPPPALPMTNGTLTELQNSVLIEWEKDTARLNQTERFNSRGYSFEGYNLYQRSSEHAPFFEWKKLATFDLRNEVMQIVQDEVDPATGNIGAVVKQEGRNTGINRYVLLKEDAFRKSPFVNGQTYFFALTSYAATSNKTSLLQSLESEPQLFTAVPHRPNPETVLPYAMQDSLENSGENVIGTGDGKIGVKILDPYSVVGGTYDFWFGISGASSTWTMVRNVSGSEYTTIKTILSAGEVAVPRPNPQPNSTGTASFTLNDAMDRISFSVNVNSVNDITSIEIGRGPKTQNGAILKVLAVNTKNAVGVWTSADSVQPLTQSVIRDLAAGFLYVIVRSVKFPNGEIRGQFFEGNIPRVSLAIPDFATSSRSVFSFPENRFPGEGISLYVSPAPVGFKAGEQMKPSRSNIVNQTNAEGTYSLIGPGIAWAGYNLTESDIEIRFTADTNWAIVNARIPAETKYIRVPFQIYQDSVRVWPVIENAIPSDSVWDIKGNGFRNGKPLFDKIVGIVSRTDGAGNDISYYTMTANGTLPAGNTLRGRLINGVNHIAKNIVFVNASDDGKPPAYGTVIRLSPYRSIKYGDIKRLTLSGVQTSNMLSAQQQKNSVNVFPNPYYGVNTFESSTTDKYVTFSRLPKKADIRIFSLAGHLVRRLTKDDPGQFLRWDLR
nr:CHRD domain-containing protein [Bacteroidota bacterium]